MVIHRMIFNGNEIGILGARIFVRKKTSERGPDQVITDSFRQITITTCQLSCHNLNGYFHSLPT